jgi:hypothetical protein
LILRHVGVQRLEVLVAVMLARERRALADAEDGGCTELAAALATLPSGLLEMVADALIPSAPFQPPVSSDWMNLVPYCLKEDLQDLHDQLYGNLGSSKNKKELVDAVCDHSSGIEILKKVPVDLMREILIHEAGLAPQEAKALKKIEIIEKLRRGELRVPVPNMFRNGRRR